MFHTDEHLHLMPVIIYGGLLPKISVGKTVKMLVLAQFHMVVFLNFGFGFMLYHRGFRG